jgi:type IV secretory pathway TrbL component
MNYVTMFIGLLILILIPEYASIFQVVIQSFIGLGIFAVGAINLLDNAN